MLELSYLLELCTISASGTTIQVPKGTLQRIPYFATPVNYRDIFLVRAGGIVFENRERPASSPEATQLVKKHYFNLRDRVISTARSSIS